MPDSPKWTPGPYTFEHVDYFITLPGLEGGTFEISNQELSADWLGQAQTLEQAQLFAMAPNLYAALLENARFLREIMRARWVDPKTTDILLRIEVQETLCARARGEQTNAQATLPLESHNIKEALK